MRMVPISLGAALVMLAAQGVSAGVIPAVPTTNVFFGDIGISIPLPAANANGDFRGAASVVLCDGSVRQATACEANEVLEALASFSVQGSIFPFIEGSISFIDAGAPTPITVTFATLIAPITGDTVTGLVGSVTVPASRTGAEVQAVFPEGFIAGRVFGSGGEAIALATGGSPILPDAAGPLTVDSALWPAVSTAP